MAEAPPPIPSFQEFFADREPNLSLTWPGKRLAVRVAVPEMRPVEIFSLTQRRKGAEAQRGGQQEENLLLHGDNAQTLTWLLANGYAGTVRLIYIDPPFDSDGDYRSQIRLRGSGRVVGGRVQYRDRWQGGDYLQFMAERLLLLRQLLHPDGTIWLHCDHRASARLQLLMEEIFGPECYLNTIAWRSQTARGAKVHARYFPRSTHSIHIFGRSPTGNPIWHAPRRRIILTRAEAAAQFMEDDGGFFRTSHPGSYRFETLVDLHSQGRIYAPHGGEVVVDRENRRVYASKGGNIGIKYYVPKEGRNRFVVTRAVDNLWDDIPGLGTIPSEDVNYPTQKTAGLLRRIVETASEPGDLVLDAFVGSGTSVAVAQQLGRRWVGCDDNWGAIRTTAQRIFNAEAQRGGGAEGQVTVYQAEGERVPPSDLVVDACVERTAAGVRVVIEDVRSPALAQLIREAGEPLPADWRAGVASIAIDPDYDGAVFRAGVVDAPAGRADVVVGEYLVTDAGETVAVRIVDVAGAEALSLLSDSRTQVL